MRYASNERRPSRREEGLAGEEEDRAEERAETRRAVLVEETPSTAGQSAGEEEAFSFFSSR